VSGRRVASYELRVACLSLSRKRKLTRGADAFWRLTRRVAGNGLAILRLCAFAFKTGYDGKPLPTAFCQLPLEDGER